eukprot:EG_transcript_37391
MVHLEESTFLLEMSKMFVQKKGKGSIWLTIKKFLPPVKKENEGEKVEPRALVRCTNGKKTIATVVSAQNVVRFQVQYATLLKVNMDCFREAKKKEKKQASSAKSSPKPSKKKGTQKSE